MIHAFFLSGIYGSFLKFTDPSLVVKGALHGGFLLAAIASLGWMIANLKSLQESQQILGTQLISLAIFGVFWSAGIVEITRFMSAHLAMQQGVEVFLFYRTSGTQFFYYQDTLICWALILPSALIYLAVSPFHSHD